jgi:hypothetical protein
VQSVVGDIVTQIVVADDGVDLNIDLMGASPKALDMMGMPQGDMPLPAASTTSSGPRTPMSGSSGMSFGPSVPTVSSMPVRPRQPGERLFVICSRLLESVRASLHAMPYGVRYLARLLATLQATTYDPITGRPIVQPPAAAFTGAQSSMDDSKRSTSSSSTPTSTSGIRMEPTESERIASDFIFLNWIVNGVMFPDQLLNENAPITSLVRSSLLRPHFMAV